MDETVPPKASSPQLDVTSDIIPLLKPSAPSVSVQVVPTSTRLPHERFAPGSLLGSRYRIVSRLGAGGMGEVYRADDLTLGSSVALKFLPGSQLADPLRRQKLLDEVRVAREVTHPNVCRVFDIGDHEGQLFLSMEYVDGEDLSSLLRRIGRFPEDRAIEIARQICYGLAAAHERGILHRDLKPANIMLDGRGRIRITDFGLAAATAVITGDEARAGTPAYMSPEQRQGGNVTVKSDLYALGLVLHEVFTGKSALSGDTLTALDRSRSSRGTSVTRSTTQFKGLDPAVERVIERCLEIHPEDRPSSAIAVASALPGGDPLAAAIAAGELPSPKLVAESGGRGRISVRLGVTLLCFFFAVFLYRAIAYEFVGFQRLVPMEIPPDALAVKARTIIRRVATVDLGKVPSQKVDVATHLERAAIFAGHVMLADGTPGSLKRLAAAHPPSMLFLYRQSPTPLMPPALVDSITDNNPPRDPGDVQVTLSSSGFLTNMEVTPGPFSTSTTLPAGSASTVPSAVPTTRGAADMAAVVPTTSPIANSNAASAGNYDFAGFFADAGLDVAGFVAAETVYNAPVPADRRYAWTGRFPGPEDFACRVEAGTNHGKLAYFTVFAPWDLPAAARINYTRPNPPAQNKVAEFLHPVIGIGRELGQVFMMILYATAFAFAFTNIGRGTADLRGGLRLAFFTYLCLFAAWILRVHHPVSLQNFGFHAMSALASPLVQAMYVFVGHLALEPVIRRFWPERLVSWSRLLEGRFKDAMVARDILIGLAGGAALNLSVQGIIHLSMYTGYRSGASHIGDYDELLSIPRAVGYTISLLFGSVIIGLMATFVLVLLRALMRRTVLAVVIFLPIWGCVVMSLYGMPSDDLQAISSLLVAGVLALLVTRSGLLAATVALTMLTLLLVLPSTMSFDAYWWPSFAILSAAYLGLAFVAFRRATGWGTPGASTVTL